MRIQHPPTHTTSHVRAALTMPPERPRIYFEPMIMIIIYARDAYAKSGGGARRGPNKGGRTTYRRGELHGRCSRGGSATLLLKGGVISQSGLGLIFEPPGHTTVSISIDISPPREISALFLFDLWIFTMITTKIIFVRRS